MAGTDRSEAAVPAVISRRDAIVGALALAAGALVAAKPEVARAANGESILMGANMFCTGSTMVFRTSNASISGTPYSSVVLNEIAPITQADYAVEGTVWYGGKAGSIGVRGRATVNGHYGVVATHDLGTGTALRVDGRAAFSRSGKATITSGHSGCTVTVGGGIDASSLVLATLQGSAGTGVYLRYAKYASPTTFTIKLNKAATTTVNIAWFVVG